MPKAKRWAGRTSNLTELEIARAHRDHLMGATWTELGNSYPATNWRNLYLLFRNRGYPLVRRQSGSAALPQSITVPTDPAVLGYIAAMIDGEGQISYSRRRAQDGRVGWRLGVNNTNLDLMEWLICAVPGSSKILRKMRTNEKWPGERLPCYEWRVTRMRDIAALLRAIEPHLVIKRALALRAIEEIDQRLRAASRTPDPALVAEADERVAWLQTLDDTEARKILFQGVKVDAV